MRVQLSSVSTAASDSVPAGCAAGVVYRARDKKSGRVLALKKVKMEKEKEGFPLTSIREINILLSLDHPNIIDVTEVRKWRI